MRSAEAIASAILENDEIMTRDELLRVGDPAGEFVNVAQGILREAGSLYERLKKAGVLDLMANMDEDAVAQAVLRLALEGSGSLGAQRAYKLIKRHAHHIL